jgi:Fur family ferric uptake transcriptional regulator
MDSAERPLSPQEVLERAQQAVPTLGIATVYRNVKSLVARGVLRAVELPGEGNRFELTGRPHHHHFQCEGCGRVFDVPGCADGLRELLPAGFTLTRHEILLWGRCGDCA